MARMTRKEAKEFTANVDRALALLEAHRGAVTNTQRELYAQLGAYHRLKLQREHPELAANLAKG